MSSLTMKNSEVAKVFSDMADLLDLKGENIFKVRAYQKAARSIEQLSVDVERLSAEGRLEEIPGVGEAIAKKIQELLTTGKLRIYEELKAEFPEGVSNLLEVPGIGPKTASRLASELGVKSVDELEQAILAGKVTALPRMGDKTAENILHHIQMLRRKKSERRIPLGRALPVVDEILKQLKAVPELTNLVPAGSLRRFQETIGDIDLMGTTDNPDAVINAFTTLPQVREIVAKGTTKASVIVAGGLQVDLRIVEDDAFGSLLQHFTGSKQHNINLRDWARHKGLSLSEYGITSLATGKIEKFTTEEGFYERLGLQYPPPEIREGGKEIELAERHELPRLVELRDIKGDLHVHSKWSEGRATVKDMALAAKALGYEYIAMTDHSVGLGVAHGLDVTRLRQQMAEIDELNRNLKGIHILKGIEVDIRSDGSLDLPDEVLAGLDIVVASIHSAMSQGQEQMTRRIIRAVENPNVDILAHPTSRLLQEREPVAVDLEAVFQVALKTRTLLEINSMPSRLDLRDIHSYRARDLGIKLVISTDTHSPEHLNFMRFGVGVARRAWCQAKDILNTYSLRDFLTYLKSHGKGKAS